MKSDKYLKINDLSVPLPYKGSVRQEGLYSFILHTDRVFELRGWTKKDIYSLIQLGIVHISYENAKLHKNALLSFTSKKY